MALSCTVLPAEAAEILRRACLADPSLRVLPWCATGGGSWPPCGADRSARLAVPRRDQHHTKRVRHDATLMGRPARREEVDAGAGRGLRHRRTRSCHRGAARRAHQPATRWAGHAAADRPRRDGVSWQRDQAQREGVAVFDVEIPADDAATGAVRLKTCTSPSRCLTVPERMA